MYALLLAAIFASADPNIKTQPIQDKLVVIRDNIQMILKLQQQGVEVDKNGTIVTGLLKKAHDLTGGQVNNLEDLIEATGGANPPASLWDRAKGWLTFVNILLVTSVVLIVAAVSWLFRLYFLFLILEIPPKAWNVIFWGACILLVLLGLEISPDYYLFLVLPGCLGMAGCWSFTCYLYSEKTDNYGFFFGVLAAIWAIIALIFSSEIIGFLAVMALLSSLGFICGMLPGVIWIGFDSKDAVPRATFAAGFLLFLHVLLTITGDTSLAPFRLGMNFMGSFVFYLGLLIVSNKWYAYDYKIPRSWEMYWTKNCFTVVMGLLALYLGTVYHMSTLLGVGGTFFYIYILEKYYEIPWEGKGWAWSLLGLGGILYVFAWYARLHPEYFFMGT